MRTVWADTVHESVQGKNLEGEGACKGNVWIVLQGTGLEADPLQLSSRLIASRTSQNPVRDRSSGSGETAVLVSFIGNNNSVPLNLSSF